MDRTTQRVSRHWHKTLRSLPKLWRSLDLSRARRKVRLASVKAYVNNSRGQLTHARLAGLDDPAVEYICSKCHRLTHFEATDVQRTGLLSTARMIPNLTTLILGPDSPIRPQTMLELLGRCKSLVHAEFRHLLNSWRHPDKSDSPLSPLRILAICAPDTCVLDNPVSYPPRQFCRGLAPRLALVPAYNMFGSKYFEYLACFASTRAMNA